MPIDTLMIMAMITNDCYYCYHYCWHDCYHYHYCYYYYKKLSCKAGPRSQDPAKFSACRCSARWSAVGSVPSLVFVGGLLGGSWVVISRVVSSLISVISIVTLLMNHL